MLLLAAHVVRFLIYVGSFEGEFGLLASGAPMNVTPRPFKHDWNVVMAAKNAVVGFCLASGTVFPDDPPAPFDPELLGSWMLTCPLEIVLEVDDALAELPQPDAMIATDTTMSARRASTLLRINRITIPLDRAP